jgi:hypothetical protein
MTSPLKAGTNINNAVEAVEAVEAIKALEARILAKKTIAVIVL